MIDVAIIGSGIVGLACARVLARRGRSVVVFDPAPERAAARVAAGMLAPWAEHPDDAASLEMRERAMALYPAWIESIEEETGARPDFAICGTLVLDDEAGSARARLIGGSKGIAERAGGARAVSESEILDAAPDVSPADAARGGVMIPAEGYVNPRTVIDALREWRAHRLEYRAEEVRSIWLESGGVRGVFTATGATETRHVVNATGAWAASIAPGFKVRPMRGELVVLRPTDGRLRGSFVIRSGSTYVVPRHDGTVVIGGTTADSGFDARPTAEGIQGILRRAFEILPALRGWKNIEVRAGLRPFLDGGPWIGRDPERAGLVHAIGMNRHGILLAPFAAERVLHEIEG